MPRRPTALLDERGDVTTASVWGLVHRLFRVLQVVNEVSCISLVLMQIDREEVVLLGLVGGILGQPAQVNGLSVLRPGPRPSLERPLLNGLAPNLEVGIDNYGLAFSHKVGSLRVWSI